MVQCDKTNRRKTLDEFALEAEGNEEEASLSLFDLLCIGIGGTVGSGVFVLTGEVYPVAGPSSALCWMSHEDRLPSHDLSSSFGLEQTLVISVNNRS